MKRPFLEDIAVRARAGMDGLIVHEGRVYKKASHKGSAFAYPVIINGEPYWPVYNGGWHVEA